MTERPNMELSENYDFVSKKGNVKVSFGYEGEVFKFFAIGPKDIFVNIVGGKGDEDEEMAWLNEKDLPTEEQRMYFMCELMNKMQVGKKKDIRKKFKNDVFERDKYTCRVCGNGPHKINADEIFDAHHITDRGEMPNGGYVKENGITLCKYGKGPTTEFLNETGSCHMKAEKFHITAGVEWEEGMHPDDLYKLIGSSKEEAIKASEDLQ